MNIAKLLNWRSLLIYTHRWMGIFFGIVFVVWFISGVVFMYVGMPVLSNAERLGHMKPLDLSTARVTPAEAARAAHLVPNSLRLEMSYSGRPLYRFQNLAKVYADTGEPINGASAEDAVELIRQWVPQYASTVRYGEYLEDSDQWTLYRQHRAQMPLHRIVVGDPADTHYYVSANAAEMVMKTDRKSRFWGYMSGVLHWTYFASFRRHESLWQNSIIWAGMIGAVMCLTGIVIGIWRVAMTARFRKKNGDRSHSPYSGWLLWHHYSGLIFGFLTCTWAFSGALSLNPFPVLRGGPATPAQRQAVAGGPTKIAALTMDQMRGSLDAFTTFKPKEMEFLQFQGEPYFLGYRPPRDFDATREIGSNEEQRAPLREHLIVSATAPERGGFQRFDDAAMWKLAREAMPGAQILDSAWLNEYDAYYYSQDGVKSLPVLRVRYADPKRTWLYLDPQHGTLTKQERWTRWNRWLYHGFHSLDLPFLYYRRPLWDIVVIVLSVGGIALSVTTLAPSWYRLRRHVRRVRSVPATAVSPRPAPKEVSL